MTVLRIAHGNGHNKASLVDFVRDADADSTAALESQRLERQWRELEYEERLRQTVARRGWTEERERERSTRILTHRGRPCIGELTRLASEKVPAYEELAPDRVLVASMYEHPVARAAGADGVAHLALHPDAGGMLRDPAQANHRVVREYRESWQTFARIAQALRRDGLLIVGTTDAQMPLKCDVPWNPRNLLRGKVPLRAAATGIDWLLYDRRLELVDWTEHRLFDHTGFIADLKEKPRA